MFAFVDPLLQWMLLLATLAILIALGYLIWGKHPGIPLYFCMVGGLFGYVTSLIIWWLFGMLLWLPYQKQLNAFGMDVHDVGWAFGVYFIPPIIGLMFLLSTLASLIALRQSTRDRKMVVVGSNMVPGLLLLLLALGSASWGYLVFDIAMLLMGLCWGFILYRIAIRRSKLRFA
jgi:hypothetical protein